MSCAWKSGKKPSPIKDIIKYKFPKDIKVRGLLFPDVYDFLKKLNIIIPIVAKIPINSFWWVNFNLESLTLEKNTPTIMTERRLQDLAITTAGKDA